MVHLRETTYRTFELEKHRFDLFCVALQPSYHALLGESARNTMKIRVSLTLAI